MSNFTFTANSITVSGKTYPAEYSITPSGAVMVFVTTPDTAEPQRVRFPKDHADYNAALAAAKAERAARAAEPVQAEPEAPTAPDAAKIPEKDFIGQTIAGHGWRIFFDGQAGRTRVIFDAAPTAAARAALEKAGFYFSSVMNSYNKKLTHKAHRAALALSGELGALYA